MKDLAQQMFWASILGTDLLGHEIQDQQQKLKMLMMCNLYANCSPGPPPIAPIIYEDQEDKAQEIEEEYSKLLIQWATSCKNAGDTLYKLLKQSLEKEDDKTSND